MKKKLIKLEIWDTSGATIYRPLTKVFYKNTPICVLVYDITKTTSFEEIKNYRIPGLLIESPYKSKFLIHLLIYFLF